MLGFLVLRLTDSLSPRHVLLRTRRPPVSSNRTSWWTIQDGSGRWRGKGCDSRTFLSGHRSLHVFRSIDALLDIRQYISFDRREGLDCLSWKVLSWEEAKFHETREPIQRLLQESRENFFLWNIKKTSFDMIMKLMMKLAKMPGFLQVNWLFFFFSLFLFSGVLLQTTHLLY